MESVTLSHTYTFLFNLQGNFSDLPPLVNLQARGSSYTST